MSVFCFFRSPRLPTNLNSHLHYHQPIENGGRIYPRTAATMVGCVLQATSFSCIHLGVTVYIHSRDVAICVHTTYQHHNNSRSRNRSSRIIHLPPRRVHATTIRILTIRIRSEHQETGTRGGKYIPNPDTATTERRRSTSE